MLLMWQVEPVSVCFSRIWFNFFPFYCRQCFYPHQFLFLFSLVIKLFLLLRISGNLVCTVCNPHGLDSFTVIKEVLKVVIINCMSKRQCSVMEAIDVDEKSEQYRPEPFSYVISAILFGKI